MISAILLWLSSSISIAGQKPVITEARKSIAGFKVRDGYPIGCKVTLRKTQIIYYMTIHTHPPIDVLVLHITRNKGITTCTPNGT